MSDVLKSEFLKHSIGSGADLFEDVYELPKHLRGEYLERIAGIERYGWSAKGQMAKIVEGQLTKELINLPDVVNSVENRLRAVEKSGRFILMQTVEIPEFGELAPHGDGRLYAGQKDS